MIPRWMGTSVVAAMLIALTGCGGDGGGGSTPVSPAATGATITSVTVVGKPVVTFVVKDGAGNPVTGLKLYDAGGSTACGSSNASLAIAKFDGSNWQSLISLQRYATDAPGMLSVIEGTTDPIPSATIANPPTALTDPATRVVGILEEANGVYTYRFAIDVVTPLLIADAIEGLNVPTGKVANNGQVAVLNGATLHRVAVQLCVVEPATRATVKLNPFLDFVVGADGKGLPFLDSQGVPFAAWQVVDRASCNECHADFAQHAGDRIDPQYCVMCHNPGSHDFETGNPIDFRLMVHKFHMGKRLTQDYAVRSSIARQDLGGGVIEGVLYPQDQRNCIKCHDGSITAVHRTRQGDNWKTRSGKNACWACHDDYKDAASDWRIAHAPYAVRFSPSLADPDGTDDSVCQSCHNNAGTGVAPTIAKSHEITEWLLSGNYRLNIWGISRNADNSLSVEYSVSNPNTGADYDLLGPLASRFANLDVLFGWNTSDYANDGGPGRGQPFTVSATADASVQRVGTSNRFRLTSPVLPADASGTVAVAFQGRVDEAGLQVPVPNLVRYFAMSGALIERREVVSAAKCNACHGQFIGYASVATFLPGLGAHGAASNDPQACVICHNGNNPMAGTVVSGGVVTQYAESADFKRMIHLKHAGQGSNYPVRPNASLTTQMGSVIYAGLGDCSACHVNDSYQVNRSILGTSVTYDVDTSSDSTDAVVTDTDASDNLVISPKASTCASCHASALAQSHMEDNGAVFGTATQGDLAAAKVFEQCDACHLPGAMAPVDVVHPRSSN